MAAGQVQFRVAWRGYDRHQVEEHVQKLQALAEKRASGEIEPEKPDDRELSPIDRQLSEFFRSGPPCEFDVVLRGYDRREVDQYLAQFER